MWIKMSHVIQGGWGVHPHSVPVLVNTDNISFIVPGVMHSTIHFVSEISVGTSKHSKKSLQSIVVAVTGDDLELALTGGRLEKLIKLGIVDD